MLDALVRPEITYLKWIPLLYGLLYLILMLFLLGNAFIYLRRNKLSGWKTFLFIIFWMYLLYLLKITIFPSAYVWEHLNTIGQYPIYVGINFELFKTINNQIQQNNNQVLLNIIAFIPFGLLFPYFLPRYKMVKTIVFGLLLTCFIECFQLFASYHLLLMRSFDVDDILCNFIGVIIGTLIYLGIHKLFRNKSI